MSRVLPVSLVLATLAIAASVASAGDAAHEPRLRDPLPFDHAEHAATFRKSGVTCVDCHPVGLREGAGPDLRPPQAEAEAPLSTCHGCHQGEVRRAPARAPAECLLCHASLHDLLPATHTLDWVTRHGAEARASGATCSNCHTASTCIDCHDERGAVTARPHPPGFRSFHGVEARLDPRSCSTCHSEAECSECHASGGLPW